MAKEYESARRAGDIIRERVGNRRQREIAAEMGVGVADLSRILTGQVAKPSMSLLCKIGNYLNISPNEMADMYGYRTLRPNELESERVNKILTSLSELEDDERERLLTTIELMLQATKNRP